MISQYGHRDFRRTMSLIRLTHPAGDGGAGAALLDKSDLSISIQNCFPLASYRSCPLPSIQCLYSITVKYRIDVELLCSFCQQTDEILVFGIVSVVKLFGQI